MSWTAETLISGPLPLNSSFSPSYDMPLGRVVGNYFDLSWCVLSWCILLSWFLIINGLIVSMSMFKKTNTGSINNEWLWKSFQVPEATSSWGFAPSSLGAKRSTSEWHSCPEKRWILGKVFAHTNEQHFPFLGLGEFFKKALEIGTERGKSKDRKTLESIL